MIEADEEMIKEKVSLEREYLELMHISDEMNLQAEIHEKMIMANIAHSLSVIADTLADRKTEHTDIHGLTDCDFCKGKNCEDCEGGKDEPQTERSE